MHRTTPEQPAVERIEIGDRLMVVRSLCTSAVAPHEWLGRADLAALGRRRGLAGAIAARAAGKAAIRAALADAGMAAASLPSPRQIRLPPDGRGRPFAEVGDAAAAWLGEAGLGLDVSLAHEEAVGTAAALVSRHVRLLKGRIGPTQDGSTSLWT